MQNTTLFFLLVFLGAASPAYSYIDLGTGSYVLQIVIASVLGSLYMVKLYWKRIVGIFSKGEKPEQENQEVSED